MSAEFLAWLAGRLATRAGMLDLVMVAPLPENDGDLPARSLVPPDEPLFAQIIPGNTASIRAFLAAGNRPICSEVMFLKRDFA